MFVVKLANPAFYFTCVQKLKPFNVDEHKVPRLSQCCKREILNKTGLRPLPPYPLIAQRPKLWDRSLWVLVSRSSVRSFISLVSVSSFTSAGLNAL
jgi:hypothetical protein